MKKPEVDHDYEVVAAVIITMLLLSLPYILDKWGVYTWG
jgi:hypothetical protein